MATSLYEPDVWGPYPFENAAANDWAFSFVTKRKIPDVIQFRDDITSQRQLVACASIVVASFGYESVLGTSGFVDDWIKSLGGKLPWVNQHLELLRSLERLLESSALRDYWSQRERDQSRAWLAITREIASKLSSVPKCGRASPKKTTLKQLREILHTHPRGHESGDITRCSDGVYFDYEYMTESGAAAIGYLPQLRGIEVNVRDTAADIALEQPTRLLLRNHWKQIVSVSISSIGFVHSSTLVSHLAARLYREIRALQQLNYFRGHYLHFDDQLTDSLCSNPSLEVLDIRHSSITREFFRRAILRKAKFHRVTITRCNLVSDKDVMWFIHRSPRSTVRLDGQVFVGDDSELQNEA